MPGSQRRRHLEPSALVAVGPVIVIFPFCLLALGVIWFVVQVVWDVAYWWFAGSYLLAAVVLFLRPAQAYIVAPMMGTRRPTAAERRELAPVWRRVTRALGVSEHHFVLRVLPSDDLNAFACGGHLVVVTTFALEELPNHELAGVLVHELSHHIGLHTVAIAIGNWLSLPVVLLARIGFWLRNVATAATRSFANGQPVLTVLGGLAALILTALSWPFTVALTASERFANLVGHGSEFQADQRAVRLGFGRPLASALRRVIAMGGGNRPIGWRERLAASHPPARTRIARIEAMLRHPTH